MNRDIKKNTFWQIFIIPAGVALMTVIGLVAALAGDGLMDFTSWLALGLPLVIIIRFSLFNPAKESLSPRSEK